MYNYFDSVKEYVRYLESAHAQAQNLVEMGISEHYRKTLTLPTPMEQKLSRINIFKKTGIKSILSDSNNVGAIIGFCEVCKQVQPLTVDLLYGDGVNLCYRERLVCEACGLNNRQRFMTAFVIDKCSGQEDTKFYVQEQVTPFYKILCNRFKNVIGSEYLGDDKKPGEIIKGIRHEDCHALSLEGDSVDIMISNDVFEHVADAKLAFSEAHRILAPGGNLIFTIPFHYNSEETIRRAGIENGKLVHYKEPAQYHGNPVSTEGSLVFYDYGADIFEFIAEAGFKSMQIVCADDYTYGYYARPSLFCAVK